MATYSKEDIERIKKETDLNAKEAISSVEVGFPPQIGHLGLGSPHRKLVGLGFGGVPTANW